CPFYRALTHRGLEDVAANLGEFLKTGNIQERSEHAELLVSVAAQSQRLGNETRRATLSLAAVDMYRLSGFKPLDLVKSQNVQTRRLVANTLGSPQVVVAFSTGISLTPLTDCVLPS